MSTPGDDAKPREILAALGIGDITAISPVSGGADTEIWRVEHGGLTSALRLFRAEQRGVANLEAVAMQAAASVLPVPEVRKSERWNDRPVMLIEWLPGIPLLHAVIADLGNAARWGRLLGETQAALHTIPAPTSLPGAASSWLGQLNPAIPAEASGSRLLHFDLHPLNVLVDGYLVSGVIDWTNAAAGDPRLDVGRTWGILEAVNLTFPGLDASQSRAVLSEFSRGWRTAYEERHGPFSNAIEPFLIWGLMASERDLARHTGADNRARKIVDGVVQVVTDGAVGGLKATLKVLDIFFNVT
jgi:aminoglycoside phosphotransferase (APT) family kinase protein